MAGPAIPSQDSLVEMQKSAVPNSAALPAKQYPLLTAILILFPFNFAQLLKEGICNPANCTCTSVSPGLPPPPSVYMMTGRFCFSAVSQILSSFL